MNEETPNEPHSNRELLNNFIEWIKTMPDDKKYANNDALISDYMVSDYSVKSHKKTEE